MLHSTFLLFLLLFTAISCTAEEKKSAENSKAAVKAQDTPPTSFEADAQGKPKYVDFNLTATPLSHPDMTFTDFANKKLVVFYFSAKCIHCQRAFPHIQKLAEKLQPRGVSFVAVAIKNNTEEDVRDFIRSFQCSFPVFHDSERNFGNQFGTGSIPVVMFVNQSGEYVRFKSFNASETPGQIISLATHQ